MTNFTLGLHSNFLGAAATAAQEVQLVAFQTRDLIRYFLIIVILLGTPL